MRNKFDNCRDNNNVNFGLFTARFVYRGPEHYIPPTGVEKKQSVLKNKQEILKQYQDNLKYTVDSYNKKFSKPRFNKWPERRQKKNPFDEPIDFDKENPARTIAQIDRILSSPYQFTLTTYKTWHTPAKHPYKGYLIDHNKRFDELINIRKLLTNSKEIQDENGKEIIINKEYVNRHWPQQLRTKDTHEDIYNEVIDNIDNGELSEAYNKLLVLSRSHESDIQYQQIRQLTAKIALKLKLNSTIVYARTYTDVRQSYEKAESDLDHKSSEAIYGQITDMMEDEERLAMWESTKSYQHIEEGIGIAMGYSQFDYFSTNANGDTDVSKKRESRQLFLSILSVETNNFDVDFILGDADEFTEDPEENKRRFPFLYEKWLDITSKNKEARSLRENVSEAKNKLIGIDNYKKIIKSANISFDLGQFNNLPALQVEKYRALINILEDALWKIKKKQADDGDIDLSSHINDIELHINLFRAQLHYELYANKYNTDIGEFTRDNLRSESNRQVLIELATEKYLKAMQMIDIPVPNSNFSELYHPAVRRALIADTYMQGTNKYILELVDDKVQLAYQENINSDIHWMLTALAESDYFNRNEIGPHLDQEHRDVLTLARTANLVAGNISMYKDKIMLIDLAIQHNNNNTTDNEKNIIKDQVASFGPKYTVYFNNILSSSIDGLKDKQNDETNKLKDAQKFIKEVQKLVKMPYPESAAGIASTSNRLIQDIEDDKYNKIITPQQFQEKRDDLMNVELNYQTFERKEMSQMDYLKQLGMRTEAIYEAYLIEIKKDPDLNVNNWDEMVLSDDKEHFAKLSGLFEQILSGGRSGKGKDNFLRALNTLHGNIDKTDLENSLNDKMPGIAIYTMLKQEIRHRQRIAVATERGETEQLAKLDGMTVGDKVENYARGVFDMAFGSGRSWTDRAAGIGVIYTAFKTIRSALKGESKTDKGLRLLLMAGATELVLHNQTGRGLLERSGLFDTSAQAAEGSYKAILLTHGEEYMEGQKDIAERDHIAALYELDDVPFNKVMEWYKSSDENGKPLVKGGPDLFPRQIDTSRIITRREGWTQENSELEARRVVWHAVHNFFDIVGDKDDKSAVEGGKMLDERWVKVVEDPNFEGEYTDLALPPAILDKYRGNQNKLTWRTVVEAELDAKDADNTKRQGVLDRITDFAWDNSETIWRWGIKELAMPLKGSALAFAENLGNEKWPQVKDYLGKMGEAGAVKLHFTKESVSFWYGAKKHTIRRFMGMHWELVKEGAKLAFEIPLALDNLAVPFAVSKVRQFKEILKGGTHTIDHPLKNTDIVRNGADLSTRTSRQDLKTNPQYRHFGEYQDEFAEAFKQTDKFYKNPISNVGYYIAETDHIDGDSLQDSYYQMERKGYESAKQQFLQEDPLLTEKDIKDYMYPIHIIVQTGQSSPEAMYTFYRMPMSDSAEFFLKEHNDWADAMDPNSHKDRPPFQVDANKSAIENIKDALMMDMSMPRTIAGGIGQYAGFILSALAGTYEAIGTGVGGTLGYLGTPASVVDQIKEITRLDPELQQNLDELFTNANDRALAMSDFYEKEDNAHAYRALHEYAINTNKPLYTKILGKLDSDYKGNWYLEKPSGFNYAHFQQWYLTWEATTGINNVNFREIITKAVAGDYPDI